MILLVAALAHAGSCCSPASTNPTVLASCDRLAVGLGAAGSAELGGWGWNGGWSAVGDDGGGTATLAAAGLVRATEWLQAGVRVPVDLDLDQLDGVVTPELGVGDGLLWVDLETPAAWPAPHAPHFALELGLGREGATAPTPGATVGVLAVRGSHTAGAWTVWGTVVGRLPFADPDHPDGDAAVVVDHAFGDAVRVGLGANVLAAAGTYPRYGVSAGPTAIVAVSPVDHLLVGARAGLPIDGLGANTPSQLMVSLDWTRVIRTPTPKD